MSSETSVNLGHIRNYLKQTVSSRFNFEHKSCRDVFKAIKSLKVKKSSGSDGISSEFLKKISVNLVYPLSVIFNQSISNGIFPTEMKLAKIIPIHKKGDTTLFDNYRPISLLPRLLLNK